MTTKTAKSSDATVKRRVGDRRTDAERRQMTEAVGMERRKLVRREKVNRRRQIDPTTCERDYNDNEVEFMQALETYKRKSGRMFPTCSEILEVIHNLGYRKMDGSSIAPSAVELMENE
ncbi:MAG: hypothetical protein K8T91_09265 [Planctomycetes bacterium]|nr:hypothetical protein [Planctomycetota bacterium]